MTDLCQGNAPGSLSFCCCCLLYVAGCTIGWAGGKPGCEIGGTGGDAVGRDAGMLSGLTGGGPDCVGADGSYCTGVEDSDGRWDDGGNPAGRIRFGTCPGPGACVRGLIRLGVPAGSG